jgi:DNA-binding NtrC family response regulator
MRGSRGCKVLPLDVEILIKNVTEEMLRKGVHLKEANKNFEVALMVLVLRRFTGDGRKAAKLLGMNKKQLFCRLSVEKIGDNWWKWSV